MLGAEIQKILTEVVEKKKKADELALEFRRFYQESQEAYNDGDGELAKELSEEGHEVQDKCQDLNKEVSDLYAKLKDLRQMTESDEFPLIALQGMPTEYQNAVLRTLKSLPAPHVSKKLIERVSYSDRYIVGSSGNPVQANTYFNQVGNKSIIVLNKQTSDGFISEDKLRIAVAHEIGHVVYRKVFTNEERGDWYYLMTTIYASFDDLEAEDLFNEEEFARVYSAYYLEDERLRNYFQEEVDFFNYFFG